MSKKVGSVWLVASLVGLMLIIVGTMLNNNMIKFLGVTLEVIVAIVYNFKLIHEIKKRESTND